jgi:hypothetical protein
MSRKRHRSPEESQLLLNSSNIFSDVLETLMEVVDNVFRSVITMSLVMCYKEVQQQNLSFQLRENSLHMYKGRELKKFWSQA